MTSTKIAYTVPEAAEAVGVSDKTIYIAINRGHLPARRKPLPDGTPNEKGKFLILHADLIAWISEMPAA